MKWYNNQFKNHYAILSSSLSHSVCKDGKHMSEIKLNIREDIDLWVSFHHTQKVIQKNNSVLNKSNF